MEKTIKKPVHHETKTAAAPVQVQRRTRENVSFTHDLYKLKPANMKRNISYKKYQPVIEEIEHGHFYHSVSRRGEPQIKCSPVGGHYHEIETFTDEKGNLTAKCGPPLRMELKVLKGGFQKKTASRIKFEDSIREKIIEDNHIHEIEYKWSEDLSEGKTIARQKQDAQAIQGMLQGQKLTVSNQPSAPAPMAGVSEQ